MTVQLALIAALDRRQAIGRDNALPWQLPEDLKRFKRLTLGHTILMGRRTAESIGRALPGRPNLVLTRQGQAPFPGQVPVASLDEAVAATVGDVLFVIGGGEVYALAMPHAAALHLTWVDTVVDGADAFFPAVDPTRWRVTRDDPRVADDRHGVAYRFVDYVSAAQSFDG